MYSDGRARHMLGADLVAKIELHDFFFGPGQDREVSPVTRELPTRCVGEVAMPYSGEDADRREN
jgi:hypothetical protein